MKKVCALLTAVLMLVCLFSTVGCDRGENKRGDKQTEIPEIGADVAVVSKRGVSYAGKPKKTCKKGAINFPDDAQTVLGADIPDNSEIVWSVSRATEFVDQGREYKPNYIVCDISVPLEDKADLLDGLRRSMKEAPKDEITGWKAAMNVRGGLLSDETERYDFYYDYNASDDANISVPCVCEAAVIVLSDRIALIVSDGAVSDLSYDESYYEPADELTQYYSLSLTRGRVFSVLRKDKIENIDDVEILLNTDLPDGSAFVKGDAFKNTSPQIDENDEKYKPYGYFARVDVGADKTDELLGILRDIAEETNGDNGYSDKFSPEYYDGVSNRTVYSFQRQYDANEEPGGRYPVTQYIYVFVGDSTTVMLLCDSAFDLPNEQS